MCDWVPIFAAPPSLARITTDEIAAHACCFIHMPTWYKHLACANGKLVARVAGESAHVDGRAARDNCHKRPLASGACWGERATETAAALCILRSLHGVHI